MLFVFFNKCTLYMSMRRKYLCESMDGRKRLLVVLIFPSVIIGSLFMLVIGGIWARYQLHSNVYLSHTD